MTTTPAPIFPLPSSDAPLIESLREYAKTVGFYEDEVAVFRAAADRIEAMGREIDVANEELDALDVQRTSFAGPFGDIKYEECTLNLAGRVKCLGARLNAQPSSPSPLV